MPHKKNQKVAIVHDWLIGGGAERVVEALHQMYPDAPIYTSYCTDEWRRRLDDKVVTGYLQHWPFAKLRKFIPVLRGLWFSGLKLDKFDLVISSSGAEAKFIKTKAKHIAYIHAPTHYYWSRYDDYMKHPGFGLFDPLARVGLGLLVDPMRKWDYRAAQRPHLLIANSSYTQNKIKQYYGRDSVVILPPVDVDRFAKLASNKERSGFIIAGRQTPYKKIDLAVAACSALNLTLTVVGKGPDHKKLVNMAGPSVSFITNAKDNDMPKLFASAKAFIFPGVDDFGIVAVEAMAAGTPVIAYKDGGALDYVTPGKTGEFFSRPEVKSLQDALQKFNPESYKKSDLSATSGQFSIANFVQKLADTISK